MSSQQTHAMLPESLKRQLSGFRRRLWTIKGVEAAGATLFAVAAAYLTLFAIDRVVDAPVWVRALLAVAGLAGCAAIPVYLFRWVWRRRRLDQLARLLSRRHPSVGDQILGVIELVGSETEQARSRTLCEAAIRQVADDAAGRDFKDAVPTPRHRLWSVLAAAPLAGAALLALLAPAAAANAWARFLHPFADVERYTFTSVEPIPDHVVVAHGEPFTLSVRLKEDSILRPARASARVARQPAVVASSEGGRFDFSMPAQIEPGWLQLRVGDVRKRIRIEPMPRPELVAASAVVELPKYLERDKPLEKDVRGGGLTVVRGASARFSLEANRGLAAAQLDGRPLDVRGAVLSSGPVPVDEEAKLEFTWRDRFGLTGLAPFAVAVRAVDDEPPSISCENLPRQKVLLHSETLNFQIRAVDDFGVKRVGMEWRGIDPSILTASSTGERILAAGGADREMLEAAGVFCPKDLGIEPQPIHLRLFVEDYLPDRPRVYSSTYVFYVLSPEQHAVWIAEQLNKWHRQSLEVRDRELQLHQANQQLRGLSPEQLDRPETRRQLEAQANAERANARRLDSLVGAGEDLVRQAMRNPEIGVGHLDRWAEMLQVLKDISENRMPSVADLLKQSAQAQGELASAADPSGRRKAAPPGPQAGNQQGQPPGGKTKPEDLKAAKSPPPAPTISDQESTQRPPDPDAEPAEPNNSNSQPGLTLPATTVVGGSSKPPAETLAQEKLDQALAAQEDLLAEFEKIADELNTVLANLEGSTLVKRLKAASRKQQAIGGKIAENIAGAFGRPETAATPDAAKALRRLAEEEVAGSRDVSNIMDDLQAYFERRRFQRFKAVLDEMREQDAVGSLRQIADDVVVQAGMSLAQTEFWSDAFDRWADNLVDPASSGQCPGSKSKGSLPPSIILEAMQILEEEVNLREQTRVAQQAKPAVGEEEHAAWAARLDRTQTGLAERVAGLSERIQELPDAEADFADEIKLLAAVEQAMHEAADVLATADTGPRAIAAETEAIELLLQSRKINPRGGGGGGANPGGGGGGGTLASALALLGAGVNSKETLEDRPVSQATGESGARFPEEFRAGLDKYFERLEQDEAGR